MTDNQPTSTEEKPGGYIESITFNNGQELKLNKNDIVVLVGPNNAGKSQVIRDIYILAKSDKNDIQTSNIVVSNIFVHKNNVSIEPIINRTFSKDKYGNQIRSDFKGNTESFGMYISDSFYRNNFPESFGIFGDTFVINLDTWHRLQTCHPAENTTKDEVKTHPIQYITFDSSSRSKLSEIFKRAFKTGLIPYPQYGSRIPLCIGEPIKLSDEYNDEQERLEAYASKLATYPQVQNQGDGIKSFVSILLYLILDHYCVYLIDEPEAFLHPPQAHIMGQIIGDTLSEQQQAFIATHSEEVIKGLLEKCPRRVKVIRITRENNSNHFAILNNEDLQKVWNDPLLKYSNIMSSLFYQQIVLCESESDCKMYSIIDGHLKEQQGKYSETLFIHCNGKNKLPDIAKALCALGVKLYVIADIDILKNENLIKKLVSNFKADWEQISKSYKVFSSSIESQKKDLNRTILQQQIEKILRSSNSATINNQDVQKLQKLLKISSGWDELKENGEQSIPRGDATSSYRNLIKFLQAAGIFIVPVGELENFVKEVGGHGPSWVDKVLHKYPDLTDPVYNTIKDFIQSMNL